MIWGLVLWCERASGMPALDHTHVKSMIKELIWIFSVAILLNGM